MTERIDDWEDHIEQTEEREEDQPDASRFEIMNFPSDITLAGYKDQWDNDQIYVPKFQRKFIWDQVRASKLIESFLLGLPVPGVFLYKERQGTKHWVIDGNQRINTVVSFQKGIFRDKKFVLKSVLPEWEGKGFDDLSEQDQFKLKTAVMRATIIQQLNPKDQSSIYYIFERLNTGGVNLNPMEVRMCIAEGSFTSLLRELNALPTWRTLIQKPKEDTRTRDIELILRVFAFYEKHASYEKPMKRFLNDYIKDNKDQSEAWIATKRKLFIEAIEKAIKISDRPFHLKGKLNYAALDSILVALMESPLVDQTDLINRYGELVLDNSFIEASTKNTSDNKEIGERIRIAKEKFV